MGLQSQSQQIYKSSTEVFNSQNQVIPATVVYFEDMVDGEMKFRPEVWFERDEDRKLFLPEDWNKLFPGWGHDGGGSDDGGSEDGGSEDAGSDDAGSGSVLVA